MSKPLLQSKRSGILLLDKAVGTSSFQALSQVKRCFNTKKVGHCGTLDPFASGLVIACINQATKIASYLEGQEKEYIAMIVFGQQTDTGDKTGQVIKELTTSPISEVEIHEILTTFVGIRNQIPPMFSALKVDGVKLYNLARKGISIERQARSITIHELEMLEYHWPYLSIRVVCSKGTYIRVLAEEIAESLGTVGHLKELRRTRIGTFHVDNSQTQDEINEETLISIPQALDFFPSITIDSELIIKVLHGMPLNLAMKDDIILLVDEANNALELYEKRNGAYYCMRGLWE